MNLRSAPGRVTAQHVLLFAAGVGLLLLAAAVAARFVTSLAVIRSYDADFLDSSIRSPID
jgi:hypothetical protein